MLADRLRFGAGKDPKLTFEGTFQEDVVNATTFNFTGLDFGAVAADRAIIVTVHAVDGQSRTITSITIGGVTPVEVEFIVFNSEAQFHLGMYIALVPTDADVTVDITWSDEMNDCAIGIHRLVDYESITAYISDQQAALSTSVTMAFVPTAGSVTLAAGHGNSHIFGIDNWGTGEVTSYDSGIDGSSRASAVTRKEVPPVSNFLVYHIGGEVCAVAASWR